MKSRKRICENALYVVLQKAYNKLNCSKKGKESLHIERG